MHRIDLHDELREAPAVPHPAPRARVATGDEHPVSAPLCIHDMTVAYHRKPVLWDVDFDAPEGKLIGIVGPNGAGKSTLLKAVLDLIPKASGRVMIYGKPYRRQRDLVAYVPQRESVDWDFPVNALDVVAMGRYGTIGHGSGAMRTREVGRSPKILRWGAIAPLSQAGGQHGKYQQRSYAESELSAQLHTACPR